MKTTKHITEERTVNKNVITIVKSLVKGAHSLKKMHVAGMGVVTYVKDVTGKNLAYLLKENGTISILINS